MFKFVYLRNIANIKNHNTLRFALVNAHTVCAHLYFATPIEYTFRVKSFFILSFMRHVGSFYAVPLSGTVDVNDNEFPSSTRVSE